jgi:hypothetical protein
MGSNQPSVGPGKVHVVFGDASGFPDPLPLSTLNGTNGFELDGVTSGDNFQRPNSRLGSRLFLAYLLCRP